MVTVTIVVITVAITMVIIVDIIVYAIAIAIIAGGHLMKVTDLITTITDNGIVLLYNMDCCVDQRNNPYFVC
jgi:hypothetical protein